MIAELDVGLELRLELEDAELMFDSEVIERVADDEKKLSEISDVLGGDEVDDKLTGITVPGFDPMENRFMAAFPKQQL